MKTPNDDIQKHLKERTICIRISAAQEEIIRAAMCREDIRFLSRFFRTAALELAERVLAPADLNVFWNVKEQERQKTLLLRALQNLELERARGTPFADWAQVSEVTQLARRLF